ncbi:MarR family transcriptional regulator [Paenibacillus motobuensis]|uniref:MarR family winged helix-turn-helix transcriptional regulator n=1 Tax=Paenibacillus TaxID=44249 RepID=UPI00203E332D|nr:MULTISPECIES: MarR family transcriptional regulator [Paenibacillus]MCM3039861.1 MarR family transcriptional regulator [Paenibacillus lutimineralis]MCM3646965.1 MarR family transcriptional regulator [Paenibacillus motobuensis]
MPTKAGQEIIPTLGFTMGVTYRKLSMYLQHRLKPFDITPEQWSVLLEVDSAEGLIQKEIAERTSKDHPTTTRILDQLESKGLVYKQKGKQDRRSYLVFSTEKARPIIEAGKGYEQEMRSELLECVTEQEYEVMMELLHRIDHHFSGVNKDF